MTATPKISIVTPSYNQGEYLEATIKSVLDQAYEGLEYVIVDAGSSDRSVDIIRHYEKRLAYWVSEPDAGHADGINKGFARTHAGIMGWINSSDVYYPWTLKTVVRIFEDLPEVKWISGIPTIVSDGAVPKRIKADHRNQYDFLSGRYNWLQQESMFWRRGLWDEVGGKLNANLKYACDFELWLRFFRKTSLCYVDTILAGFRTHENQRGAGAVDVYRAEAAQAFAGFRRFYGNRDRLRANFIRLTNGRQGRLFRALLRHFGLIRWYAHPQILFDFEEKRWVLAKDSGADLF
ncbi:MAG: glycosyltransferase [Deltaproteobacteria bacterium]|nr:glycosyltransferase [Deltaproteobacteria bacterium]